MYVAFRSFSKCFPELKNPHKYQLRWKTCKLELKVVAKLFGVLHFSFAYCILTLCLNTVFEIELLCGGAYISLNGLIILAYFQWESEGHLAGSRVNRFFSAFV